MQQQTNDWERLASTLTTVELRTTLGATGLIEQCAQTLLLEQQHDVEVQNLQLQAIRVIGNLCFEHNENRQRCLDYEIPQSLLKLIQATLDRTTLAIDISSGSIVDKDIIQQPRSILELKLIRAGVGALMNSSLTFDPIRDVLRQTGSLRTLLNIIDARSHAPIYSLVSQTQLSSSSDPEASERLELGLRIVAWTMNILSDVLSEADKSSFPVGGVSALASLVLAIQSASSSNETILDENSDDVDLNIDIISQAAQLIESLSMEVESAKEEIGLAMYSTQSSLLSLLIDFIQFATLPASFALAAEDFSVVSKAFSNVKSAIVRAVVEAPNSDTVMEKLFALGQQSTSGRSWIIERMVDWLERPTEGREDMVICATHLLAALGRKDENCIALVHLYNVIRPLSILFRTYVQLAMNPISPTTSTTSSRSGGETTQILFGLVSLLRHLAIPDRNKLLLSTAGVMLPAAMLLRRELDSVPPLQNAAVGLIKHVTAASDSTAAVRFLAADESIVSESFSTSTATPVVYTETPQLDIILALISRTDDTRIKSEATRILNNLIRSVFATKASSSTITESTVFAPEVILKARTCLIREEVVNALSEMMIRSEKYPMLINEAIIGLTLIAASGSAGGELVLKGLMSEHLSTALIPEASIVEAGDDQVQTIALVSNSAAEVLISWFTAAPSIIDPTPSTSTSLRSEMIQNGCTLVGAVCSMMSNEAEGLREKFRESMRVGLTTLEKNAVNQSLKVSAASTLEFLAVKDDGI